MVRPSRKVARIVKRYVEAIRRRGIEPEVIYLFGSHARGSASRYSDVDLLVVWRGFRRMGYLRSYTALGQAAADILEPIQAIPCTPAQFSRPIPGGFLDTIASDCVPVFQAD